LNPTPSRKFHEFGTPVHIAHCSSSSLQTVPIRSSTASGLRAS
jgi:hypothetical protein